MYKEAKGEYLSECKKEENLSYTLKKKTLTKEEMCEASCDDVEDFGDLYG